MNNLLENLNQEQLQAVLHKDGPLLIVAGAGTGKTTVITQRIAYLIEQGLAKSDEILALTFTEKSAAEMADRVGALLPYGYFDLWISTFHSFAERIIKEHGLTIGLSTDFKLLNSFEQWALVKKNLDKFELDYYRPLGNPTKFIHALIKHFSRAKDEDVSPAAYLEYADGLKQDLDQMLSGNKSQKKSVIPDPSLSFPRRRESRNSSGALNSGSPIAPFRSAPGLVEDDKKNIGARNDKKIVDDKMNEQEAARLNEIANAYQVYQQLLLDNNALDFGDLINYTLKLFRERPTVLEKYRQQFKYILVDEFQDTNWAQYELIKLLAAPAENLVVVGDDDQSIYKFRGASLSNILQFKKDYVKAKEIILVKNYRSRQNILDLSYEFIKQNNPNRLEWQLENSTVIIDPSLSFPRRRESRNSSGELNSGSPIAPFRSAPGLVEDDKKNIGARNDNGGEKSKKLSKKLIAENKGQGEIEVLAGADLNQEVKLVADKIVALKKQDKTSSLDDFAVLVRANSSADDFMAEFERRGLPYIFGASRGLYSKPIIMDAIAYFKLLDNYHESPSLYRILNLPVFQFSAEELIDFNHLASKKALSLYEVLKSAEVLKFDDKIRKKIQPLLALLTKHSTLAREKSASQVFLAFMNDSGYLKDLAGSGERKNLEAINLLNQFLKRLQDFESSSADKSVKAFLAELNLEMEAGEEGDLAPDLEAGPETIKILTAHGAKGLEFKYVFIANLVDKRFPTIERKEPIELPDALVKEILPEGDIHLEEERRLFYVAMTRAKQGLYFSWASDYGGMRDKKPSRFLVELGMVKNDKFPMTNVKSMSNDKLQMTNEILNTKYKIQNTIPAHFSYSQLAAYSACPYQYRFAHILKIPTLGKEQFSFGKTLHSTLQKLFTLINEKKGLGQGELFGGITSPTPPLQGGQISPPSKGGLRGLITFDEILKLYEQSWVDDWYKDKKSKQERKKQGQEILKVFYEKYKNNWPEVLFLEKGFNFRVVDDKDSYVVRGVVDRIDKITGGLKLVDYKTGAPKNKLKFEEKEQLLIYQLAIQELFKQEVKALAFYYLDNNSEVEFIGTAKELEKIKAKIIATIKEIKQGRFKPKPGVICAWCDFKQICEFRK